MDKEDKEYDEIIRKKSQNWLKAAQTCDRSNTKEKIAQAARDIEDFLKSEHGQIALHGLLRATNKSVIFAENKRLHPDFSSEIYVLSNAGPLCVQIKLSSKDILMPMATPISTESLVAATVEHTNRMPHLILLFLLDELDKISASVLNAGKNS